MKLVLEIEIAEDQLVDEVARLLVKTAMKVTHGQYHLNTTHALQDRAGDTCGYFTVTA